jgi:hypothetical protein
MTIELYWLPLGAGGWFVRLNGRIWEAIQARRERRRPLDLYHTALVVPVPEGRFVIENSWPIPVADGTQRGVVVQGPVFSRRLARWRVFRYEVRRWLDGVIADEDEAVASPQLLSDDLLAARRLLDLVGRCRHQSGAETSSGRARCGTRTRSSRGCSPAPACQRTRSVPRRVAARQDGRRASSPPTASRPTSGSATARAPVAARPWQGRGSGHGPTRRGQPRPRQERLPTCTESPPPGEDDGHGRARGGARRPRGPVRP